MDYIIPRDESHQIDKEKAWPLLYGRRKTGKTFLLRNFCHFDAYYLVKRNLSVFSEAEEKTLPELLEEVKKHLQKGKTVIIDEFQRLDESFLEELTLLHPKGKLILTGSSMRIIKKFFEPQSALLGFFTPIKMSFITPGNALREIKKKNPQTKAIELSTFLREPWLIPSYQGEDILKFVYHAVKKSKLIIPALIGEIFNEEERELSKKYEALITLIGEGIWNTKKLASLLYDRKLIPDASVTNLAPYLKNLEEMGLVESIKLFNERSNYYRLASPIMNIFYYLDSRYDIKNRDVSFEEVKPALSTQVNLEIQNFIADYFAEKHSGRKEYYIAPDQEVDFIITQRNKPVLVGEVKWKKASASDLRKFEEKTRRLQGKKIIIFKEGRLKESLNASDLVKEA